MMLRLRVWIENATIYRWKNWRAHRRGEQGSIHAVVGRWTYYHPKPMQIIFPEDKSKE